MSKLIKDLEEDGENEGWYGEFFEVEVYVADLDEWQTWTDRIDWRAKAEGHAQHLAEHDGLRARVVLVREIRQPIAGAVFEPKADQGDATA